MVKLIVVALAGALVIYAGSLSVGTLSDPVDASADLDSEEQAFVNLINQYRQQNGLGTLTINTVLGSASEWMSADMGAHNYFSHCDLHGLGPGPDPCPAVCDYPCRDPFQRMKDFGYGYNTWLGENLAAGTSSAQVAFDLWKASGGHNANMLNPNFTVMGLARVYTAGSTYSWYWTNDFGGYNPGPDADSDGVIDTADNCPNVANGPAQAGVPGVGNQTNTDQALASAGARMGNGNPPPPLPGDTAGDACDADDDNDAFTDSREQFLSTAGADNCAGSPPGSGGDAWAPDTNADQVVNSLDLVIILGNSWQKSTGQPGYNPRADLNGSGTINILDISLLRASWQHRCA